MILVTPLPGTTRASINLRLIRHAESKNNQVYRDARFLFRGGTPDFDQDGWESHVAQYRSQIQPSVTLDSDKDKPWPTI
jgi:hypothetical protein